MNIMGKTEKIGRVGEDTVPTVPPVTISAKSGKDTTDTLSVVITDPYGNLSLDNYIKQFGETIILGYFQAGRTTAIQRIMRAVLKKDGVDAAIRAGLAKCKSLDPIKRANAKTQRQTRTAVEAMFIEEGYDVSNEKFKTIIDKLFVK